MFRIGSESRKPSYLNHDAIKFPGVGDYSINKNQFGSPGYSMGLKSTPGSNKNPGPLDYSPKYASIQNKSSSPTTFGKADR